MRRLLCALITAVVLLCAPVPAWAVWGMVLGQNGSATGNDAVIGFTSPVSVGNQVIIWVVSSSTSQTVSITDTTGWTWNTVAGPIDDATNTLRSYIFCATAADTDNSYIVTTSGSASAHSIAAEFTGGSCTVDGTAQSAVLTATTTWTLGGSTISVGNAGSMIVGMARSTTAAAFTAGSNMTDVGVTTTSMSAEYRVVSSSGSYDVPFSAAANETGDLTGVGLAAASGGSLRGLALLGVGCPN